MRSQAPARRHHPRDLPISICPASIRLILVDDPALGSPALFTRLTGLWAWQHYLPQTASHVQHFARWGPRTIAAVGRTIILNNAVSDPSTKSTEAEV